MFFGFDLSHVIEIMGYPGIFAIILAESGLFFAASLPGGSLLFTAGLLASQGFLNIFILFPVVILAAVLGDLIGFTFGSWVGPALFRRPDSRFFKKKHLFQTRAFFEEHGTKMIILARFIPVVRTFAPILAGIVDMHYRTFLTYNILGAILWGGGFVLGGYILGETVPGIEGYLEYFIIGIIVVTTLPFILQVRKARNAPARPTMPNASVIVFDLDDTLADSFTPPSDHILAKLQRLARVVPVAIMSGADYTRVERDVMHRMTLTPDATLLVFTDSAAQCVTHRDGAWHQLYKTALSADARKEARDAIIESLGESNIAQGIPPTYRILERDASVAFTALPEGASAIEKRAWDQDGSKRKALARTLAQKLPTMDVHIGGKTTVDITHKGVNKAYGVEWLARHLDIQIQHMLFIGDAFYAGGNDAIVIPTGIQTLETSGPLETERMIDALLDAHA